MAALALGKIGGFLAKSFVADQALDLVTGRKNKKKQPPTKETWKNYMGEKGEKPASEQTIDVEVLGKETVGANANDLGTFTKAPEDPKPESTGNEDSIVAQINKINSNISAISNAMQSSADIEEEYRKNLKEDLEQDIADRDKLQAKERAKNRRDSFRKNLLSGPKKVAGVAGSTLAKGLGLEALAALFPTKEERKDRIKKTLVGDDTKPKPEGFMRGLAGIADFVTGDLTDFDNRGVIGSEINASILENRDKKDDKTDKTIKDKNKASEFIGGKNETTNETINEINNNTTNTNNNSTNKTTKVNEKTIKGDLTTITSDGKTIPRGLPGPVGETFGGKGGSTYSEEWQQSNQVNPNNIEKSAGSLIAGISGAVDKTAPVEDQKGSIRVFDRRSKRSGKGAGGSTPGKGVSDEVPSLSPERRVSPNETFQRSSVA